MKKINKQSFSILVLLISWMFYTSCNSDSISNLLPIIDNSDDMKSPEFYECMLEKFCQEHYDSLYEDFWGTRTFVEGSLEVDSVCKVEEREVNVYGKHDFVGRLGWPLYHRKFVANVYETNEKANEYIITFEKESKRLITRKHYKESRTRAYHYEE